MKLTSLATTLKPDNNMSDLVSVIIPAYNHEIYVTQAIRSVSEQTYGRLELILIDDKSTDSTFYVAKGALEELTSSGRFERVILRRHAVNKGAHATINEGIVLASGHFVTILNSDDYFAPTRIEALVRQMQVENSELGFSLTTPVDMHSRPFKRPDLPPSLTDAFEYILWARDIFPTISFSFLSRNVAISTGNLVFSKRLYKHLGGFCHYKYIHDWDFALRACLVTEPTFVASPLYMYRLHSTNSFSSLGNIGEQEVNSLTRGVFSLFDRAGVYNLRAPIPRFWPGCFEAFESELYLVKRARSLNIPF